jgi:hypothetical protein
MLARIYKPSKSAMSSGRARSRDWVLEFEPASARHPDPLMGWSSSSDMNGQIRLSFETDAEAVAYCQAHGIAFQLSPEKPRHHVIKAYADNFAANRREPWTH